MVTEANIKEAVKVAFLKLGSTPRRVGSGTNTQADVVAKIRSEERRVGKEC